MTSVPIFASCGSSIGSEFRKSSKVANLQQFRQACRQILSPLERNQLQESIKTYKENKDLETFVRDLCGQLDAAEKLELLKLIRNFIPFSKRRKFDKLLSKTLFVSLLTQQLHDVSQDKMSSNAFSENCVSECSFSTYSSNRNRLHHQRVSSEMKMETTSTEGTSSNCRTYRFVTINRDGQQSLSRTDSLGFGIRGGREYGIGIFVTEVEEDTPAALSGLRPGDEILEANGEALVDLSISEAGRFFMTAFPVLRLMCCNSGFIPANRLTRERVAWLDPLSRKVTLGPYSKESVSSIHQPPLTALKNPKHRKILSQLPILGPLTPKPSDAMTTGSDDPNKVPWPDDILVQIRLGPGQGLGLRVRGGREFGLGIFVSSLDDIPQGSTGNVLGNQTMMASPAKRCGIKIGDQIVAANSISFISPRPATHREAVDTLASLVSPSFNPQLANHPNKTAPKNGELQPPPRSFGVKLSLTLRRLGVLPTYKEVMSEITWQAVALPFADTHSCRPGTSSSNHHRLYPHNTWSNKSSSPHKRFASMNDVSTIYGENRRDGKQTLQPLQKHRSGTTSLPRSKHFENTLQNNERLRVTSQYDDLRRFSQPRPRASSIGNLDKITSSGRMETMKLRPTAPALSKSSRAQTDMVVTRSCVAQLPFEGEANSGRRRHIGDSREHIIVDRRMTVKRQPSYAGRKQKQQQVTTNMFSGESTDDVYDELRRETADSTTDQELKTSSITSQQYWSVHDANFVSTTLSKQQHKYRKKSPRIATNIQRGVVSPSSYQMSSSSPAVSPPPPLPPRPSKTSKPRQVIDDLRTRVKVVSKETSMKSIDEFERTSHGHERSVIESSHVKVVSRATSPTSIDSLVFAYHRRGIDESPRVVKVVSQATSPMPTPPPPRAAVRKRSSLFSKSSSAACQTENGYGGSKKRDDRIYYNTVAIQKKGRDDVERGSRLVSAEMQTDFVDRRSSERDNSSGDENDENFDELCATTLSNSSTQTLTRQTLNKSKFVKVLRITTPPSTSPKITERRSSLYLDSKSAKDNSSLVEREPTNKITCITAKADASSYESKTETVQSPNSKWDYVATRVKEGSLNKKTVESDIKPVTKKDIVFKGEDTAAKSAEALNRSLLNHFLEKKLNAESESSPFRQENYCSDETMRSVDAGSSLRSSIKARRKLMERQRASFVFQPEQRREGVKAERTLKVSTIEIDNDDSSPAKITENVNPKSRSSAFKNAALKLAPNLDKIFHGVSKELSSVDEKRVTKEASEKNDDKIKSKAVTSPKNAIDTVYQVRRTPPKIVIEENTDSVSSASTRVYHKTTEAPGSKVQQMVAKFTRSSSPVYSARLASPLDAPSLPSHSVISSQAVFQSVQSSSPSPPIRVVASEAIEKANDEDEEANSDDSGSFCKIDDGNSVSSRKSRQSLASMVVSLAGKAISPPPLPQPNPVGPDKNTPRISLKDWVEKLQTSPSKESIPSPTASQKTSSFLTSTVSADGFLSTRIEVDKSLGGSLGLGISGGADTLQQTVSIDRLLDGTLAGNTPGLRVGQRMFSVDSQSLDGLSHESVVALIRRCFSDKAKRFLTLEVATMPVTKNTTSPRYNEKHLS